MLNIPLCLTGATKELWRCGDVLVNPVLSQLCVHHRLGEPYKLKYPQCIPQLFSCFQLQLLVNISSHCKTYFQNIFLRPSHSGYKMTMELKIQPTLHTPYYKSQQSRSFSEEKFSVKRFSFGWLEVISPVNYYQSVIPEIHQIKEKGTLAVCPMVDV